MQRGIKRDGKSDKESPSTYPGPETQRPLLRMEWLVIQSSSGKLRMGAHTLNLALGRLNQDCCEFKASWGYTVNSRLAQEQNKMSPR